MVVARGWGEGFGELAFNGYGGSVGEGEKLRTRLVAGLQNNENILNATEPHTGK